MQLAIGGAHHRRVDSPNPGERAKPVIALGFGGAEKEIAAPQLRLGQRLVAHMLGFGNCKLGAGIQIKPFDDQRVVEIDRQWQVAGQQLGLALEDKALANHHIGGGERRRERASLPGAVRHHANGGAMRRRCTIGGGQRYRAVRGQRVGQLPGANTRPSHVAADDVGADEQNLLAAFGHSYDPEPGQRSVTGSAAPLQRQLWGMANIP